MPKYRVTGTAQLEAVVEADSHDNAKALARAGAVDWNILDEEIHDVEEV